VLADLQVRDPRLSVHRGEEPLQRAEAGSHAERHRNRP
jgi:hypothetical protein